MDLHNPAHKEVIRFLKQKDEQLAYLAALTCQGIKPLSRYEKPLDEKHLNLLKKLDLQIDIVSRTVRTGKIVHEIIFSMLSGYMDLYKQRYDQTPIDKSADTVRLEGFLFGFPPCCVDAFLQAPYSRNGLSQEDQKILFYWACPECRITPFLLPLYRKLYTFIEEC